MSIAPVILPPNDMVVSSARNIPPISLLATANVVTRLNVVPTANNYTGQFLTTYSGRVGEAVNAPIDLPAKEMVSGISALSPSQRMRFFAKNDPVTFASSIVGIPASVYLIGRAVFESGLYAKIMSFAAYAQTQNSQVVVGSSRDTFDWYVGGLMGLVLLGSVGATLFATTESKISFGKDTTKTIVGFIIGFLSGGKAGR